MADLAPTKVDLRASGASVVQVQLGETVTLSMPLYRSTTDNKFYMANCNGTDEESTVEVIALTGGVDGSYVLAAGKGSQLDFGVTLTICEEYVLSDTDGKIMPKGDLTTGQNYTRLGYATATNTFVVDIAATLANSP